MHLLKPDWSNIHVEFSLYHPYDDYTTFCFIIPPLGLIIPPSGGINVAGNIWRRLLFRIHLGWYTSLVWYPSIPSSNADSMYIISIFKFEAN